MVYDFSSLLHILNNGELYNLDRKRYQIMPFSSNKRNKPKDSNLGFGRHSPTPERPYFVSDLEMAEYSRIFQDILSQGIPRDAAISTVNHLAKEGVEKKSRASSPGGMRGSSSTGGSGSQKPYTSQPNVPNGPGMHQSSSSTRGRNPFNEFPSSTGNPYGGSSFGQYPSSFNNYYYPGSNPGWSYNYGGSYFGYGINHDPTWDTGSSEDWGSTSQTKSYGSHSSTQFGSQSGSSSGHNSRNYSDQSGNLGESNYKPCDHSGPQDPHEVNRAGWYTYGPPKDPPLNAKQEKIVRELMDIKKWSREKAIKEMQLDDEEIERQERLQRRASLHSSSPDYRGGQARDAIVEALMIAGGYRRREAQDMIAKADLEVDEEEAYREKNASRYRPATFWYGPYSGSSNRFGSVETTPKGLSREAREEIRAILRRRYCEHEIKDLIQKFDDLMEDVDW